MTHTTDNQHIVSADAEDDRSPQDLIDAWNASRLRVSAEVEQQNAIDRALLPKLIKHFGLTIGGLVREARAQYRRDTKIIRIDFVALVTPSNMIWSGRQLSPTLIQVTGRHQLKDGAWSKASTRTNRWEVIDSAEAPAQIEKKVKAAAKKKLLAAAKELGVDVSGVLQQTGDAE